MHSDEPLVVYHGTIEIHWLVCIFPWEQLESTRGMSLWCGMLPFVVAWQHFHVAGQNFEEIQLSGKGTVKGSLIPRSKEEEEKGPGFSHSRMCLIVVEFHYLHILLIYFIQSWHQYWYKMFTLSLDFHSSLQHAKNSLSCTHPAADLKLWSANPHEVN